MPERLTQTNRDEVKQEIRQILIQVAKAQQVITYSELTAMLQTAYIHYHSSRLVSLLTDIGSEEVEAGRGVLPALVVTKQTGLPGAGFFKTPNELGDEDSDPQAIWAAELKQVYDYWSEQ